MQQNRPGTCNMMWIGILIALLSLSIVGTVVLIMTGVFSDLVQEQLYYEHIETFDEMIDGGGPVQERLAEFEIVTSYEDLGDGNVYVETIRADFNTYENLPDDFIEMKQNEMEAAQKDGTEMDSSQLELLEEEFLQHYNKQHELVPGMVYYDTDAGAVKVHGAKAVFKEPIYPEGVMPLAVDPDTNTAYDYLESDIREEFTIIDNRIRADQYLEEIHSKRAGYLGGAAATGACAIAAGIGLGLAIRKRNKSEALEFARDVSSNYDHKLEDISEEKCNDENFYQVKLRTTNPGDETLWRDAYLDKEQWWNVERDYVEMKIDGKLQRISRQDILQFRSPPRDYKEYTSIKSKYPEAFEQMSDELNNANSERIEKATPSSNEMARLELSESRDRLIQGPDCCIPANVTKSIPRID